MSDSPAPAREVRGAIRLRAEDNVAVACRSLTAGEEILIDGERITLLAPVQLGHKIALGSLRVGDAIRKYGQTIGFASREVASGEHVHVHNCSAESFDRDYAFSTEIPSAPSEVARERTFDGFHRPDGRVGTRNCLAIISTVNCSASTSRAIADAVRGDLAGFPNVDGVLPLTHKGGCAMRFDGDDHQQLNRVLAGFARHPNVGAYLIVGLGCETGQATHLLERERLVQVDGVAARAVDARDAPLVLTIQESGGIASTIAAGARAVRELLPRVDAARRASSPASRLILGTQCGGSDGASGITANPALGVASDRIVAQGGTSVLGETPEIYGAEHLLTRRAIRREVGEALVERIRWWEWYTSVFGAEINNNPSPGNKAGGLTTIYEKSLGAVAKGGSTALTAVYRYAETVTEPGFVVMDTPGYDPASLTGIVAGGANVCVFTTGRGSVYGCKPVPCIKISTNTPLYRRMESDMDLDAGTIFAGESVASVGERIFEEILAVASGKRTKSEIQDIGEEEFAPWSIGPVL